MALTSLFRRNSPVTIGSIEVDVTLTETHSQSAQITESPIETGSNVQDHRIVGPARLSMEGVVSNRPTTLRGLANRTATAEERYDLLIQLFENGDPVTVVTNLRTYENMVFANFSVRRNARSDEIVQFTAELQQLEFADSEVVPLPDSVNDRGQKATTTASSDATTSAQKTSVTSNKSPVTPSPGTEGLLDVVLGN